MWLFLRVPVITDINLTVKGGHPLPVSLVIHKKSSNYMVCAFYRLRILHAVK